ncbi:YicC/YloC family endoribonuclease [Fervidobacterium sp.]
MPRSMTGYAKIQKILEDYKVTCEVKTLNSKGLTIDVSTNYFLNSKELDAISKVKEYISRGKVSVRIWVKFIKPVQVSVDYSLLKTYYEALSDIRESLNIPVPVELSHLLNFRDAFQFDIGTEEVENAWQYAKTVLEEALQEVVMERKIEGEKLTKDLADMVFKMQSVVDNIRERANDIPKMVAQRIKNNTKELLPDDVELNRELFESAVALIADRADIREELVRLDSHLKRTRELLSKDESIGDMLNFISQEMLREFNTILSKSRFTDITNLALEGKYIVSQFKEQIMNIE